MHSLISFKLLIEFRIQVLWPAAGLQVEPRVRYIQKFKKKFEVKVTKYYDNQGAHLNPAMSFAMACTGKRKKNSSEASLHFFK